MRISDWSSDVCSSDLLQVPVAVGVAGVDAGRLDRQLEVRVRRLLGVEVAGALELVERAADLGDHGVAGHEPDPAVGGVDGGGAGQGGGGGGGAHRSCYSVVEIGRASWRARVCK